MSEPFPPTNTELAGSPETGSRLEITDSMLDRAAQDVRLSLEEMLSRLPFDDASYSPKPRGWYRRKRRVLRENMAPPEREETGRADARGSVSARTLDGFGRCAVCGRREKCCRVCHVAHDFLNASIGDRDRDEKGRWL